MSIIVKGSESSNMNMRLTSIDVWYDATNGTNTDNRSRGLDQHTMEVVHHSHRTENIDIKHPLHEFDFGINGSHGVTWEFISCFGNNFSFEYLTYTTE